MPKVLVESIVDIIVDARDSIFNVRVTPHNIVWTALENAVRTVDKLPDQEKSWLRNDAKVWSMSGLSPTESRQIAKSFLMAGAKPDSLPSAPPSIDLEAALLTMEWFGYCRQGDDDRLQKAAYHLAGDRPEVAAAHFRPGCAFNRKLLNDIKTLSCVAILNGLTRDYGIEVIADGVLIVDSGE